MYTGCSKFDSESAFIFFDQLLKLRMKRKLDRASDIPSLMELSMRKKKIFNLKFGSAELLVRNFEKVIF